VKPIFYRKPIDHGRTQALMVRGFASDDGETQIDAVLEVMTGSHAGSVREEINILCNALNTVYTDWKEGKL